MRTATSLSLVLVGVVLMCGSTSAQITCFSYPGGMVSCDGPRALQNTTQIPLSPNQGVIMDDRGNLEPYTLIPSQPQRPPSLWESDRFTRPQGSGTFRDQTGTFGSIQSPSSPLFLPGLGGEAGQ